nr:MAG TPA: hypothetical protein [Caudoviricetes sp.]
MYKIKCFQKRLFVAAFFNFSFSYYVKQTKKTVNY